MKTWLTQLLSDGEMPSTLRVLVLFLVLVVVLPIMTVWTMLCIRQNQFIIPDIKVVTLLITTIVTAIGGKVMQSGTENLSPKSQTQDPKS